MQTQSAAAVFSVTDFGQSLTYYKEVLGFTEEFRVEQYAGIVLGQVRLHLAHYDNPNMKTPGSGNVYVFCDEVDEFYRLITSKGARTAGPPKNYSYQMRDFISYDPDGNVLTFGTDVSGE